MNKKLAADEIQKHSFIFILLFLVELLLIKWIYLIKQKMLKDKLILKLISRKFKIFIFLSVFQQILYYIYSVF